MGEQGIWTAVPMTYHSYVEAEKCQKGFEFFQTSSKLSHVIPPEDMSLNFCMVIGDDQDTALS